MVEGLEPGSYARPWDPDDPKVSASDEPDIVVRLGVQRWPFWYDETTGRQQRTVRDVTGSSAAFWIAQVVRSEFTAPDETGSSKCDLDAWCVLAWMARIQCGEAVSLSDIEISTRAGDDYAIEAPIAKKDDEAEDDPSPEA